LHPDNWAARHHTDHPAGRKSAQIMAFRGISGLADHAWCRGTLILAAKSVFAGAEPRARRTNLTQGCPDQDATFHGWGPDQAGRGLFGLVDNPFIIEITYQSTKKNH